MIANLRVGLALLAAVVLMACGAPQEKAPADVAGLAQALISLDPAVDPAEAARAAEISYNHSLVLRRDYHVTDSALMHNAKVNQGLRPRGLCWHWADDLQTRLRQEEFQTLDMHRAIANHDTILIEHSISFGLLFVSMITQQYWSLAKSCASIRGNSIQAYIKKDN
jgi:hypothetical protein